MTSTNTQHYCDALCCYLRHLELELSCGRMDLLRHYADPLCALANGYITRHRKPPLYSGNHETYKTSCFASKDALGILQAKTKGWKREKGDNLHLEHVIPIAVIRQILQTKRQSLKDDKMRLDALNQLLIPCVITQRENKELNRKFQRSMPKGWNMAWDRYRMTPYKKHSLFDEIVALRSGLPNSQNILTTLSAPSGVPTPAPIVACSCANTSNVRVSVDTEEYKREC